MDLLLKAVGGIWASIGVWQIVQMTWKLSGGQKYYDFPGGPIEVNHWAVWQGTAMVAMLLYIMPGLVVMGVGALISRRMEEPPWTDTSIPSEPSRKPDKPPRKPFDFPPISMG